MSWIGVAHRLARLFCIGGRAFIFPVDDALIAGPTGALGQPDDLMSAIGGIDGLSLLAFPGTYLRFVAGDSTVGRIVNLTASTTRSAHTRKVTVGSVEGAIALGADAVAFHVNISSRFEHEMLAMGGAIVERAHTLGVPVVGILYPRAERADGDENYLALRDRDENEYSALVAHAARVGVELGVDVLKTVFTGSASSFSTVVEACGSVPVVIAGGPLRSKDECLTMARAALEGGAAGLSFGRNVFLRESPLAMLKEIRALLISP